MFYDTHPNSHRGHGGPHGGGGRGGFWRGGGGPDDFGRGRKLSSEALQLLLLGLLENGPAHGYELMRRLEEHSGGYYSPSPGMIYPALAYLDDAGEIVAEAQGNRKSYRLTPQGEHRLNQNRDVFDAHMSSLGQIGSRMQEVRDAFTGLHDQDPAAANDLHEARHRLKQALYQKRGCSPEEARRIADALNRLADEILGPTKS
ncbi:MAG: PadR family transcriptional regulator [Caulobacteraceae bacterium]|nr:PadR family transcriptional regulator [Caulobacteraceae bacterium]